MYATFLCLNMHPALRVLSVVNPTLHVSLVSRLFAIYLVVVQGIRSFLVFLAF